MSVVIVTGSAGLVGSETTRHFAGQGFDVVGLDNDMRRHFFGDEASTRWQSDALRRELGPRYVHLDLDIRDTEGVKRVFRRYGASIKLVVHTAAQPSHDKAGTCPTDDYSVNAVGTLGLLEATRRFAPRAPFIFTSTNKVYGDRPNQLPLVETPSRWEITPDHRYADGVLEDMPIDQTLHSLFGASKVAADVLVQEYGRYYGLATVCFRAGCLTGPRHSGAQLHGFLAYLVKCAITKTLYVVLGYGGRQVRDNLHAADLVQAFDRFFRAPRVGDVYNIGGGRFSNCSVLEAIGICEEITGEPMDWSYSETNRRGDHKWWISGLGKFASHYPGWQPRHDVRQICREIYEANAERWLDAVA